MNIAVSRQYAHSFVGMFTNGVQSPTPLTVPLGLVDSNTNLNRNEMPWASNQDKNSVFVGDPHEVSRESGAFWMGRVFGGMIASYYHESLRLETLPRHATSGQPYIA